MTKPIASTSFAAALLSVALAASAAAQVEIDRRRPAPARGEVHIDNDFGSVAVHGWDKAEVLVRGTVAAGAEGFDFDSDKEGTSISVSVPDAWFQAAGEDPAFRTALDVFVPSGSSLSISTVNATGPMSSHRGMNQSSQWPKPEPMPVCGP